MQILSAFLGLGKRWLVLASLLVVGLSLVAAVLFYFGWIPGLRKDTPIEAFPPQALADYLPADTAAVYGFDVRQILTSSRVQEHFGEQLKMLAQKGSAALPWMKLTGLKLLEDVDRIRVLVSSEDPFHPVWVFQGRFPRGRFKVGPSSLEEKIENRFRLYEYHDPTTKTATYLAPAGTYLVVSGSRDRVLAALNYAAAPTGPAPRTAVTELLKGVDTKQGLWLAAAFHRFAGLKADIPYLSLVLNPILLHARTVAGGMTFGDKLVGDFHFQVADEEAATRLEDVLASSCKAARGFAELLGNSEWTPVLRLMGTGEVHREGTRVDLHCQFE